jgi:hypothetical protein
MGVLAPQLCDVLGSHDAAPAQLLQGCPGLVGKRTVRGDPHAEGKAEAVLTLGQRLAGKKVAQRVLEEES